MKVNPSLKSLRGCAGLYQLLVSPDPAVRCVALFRVASFFYITESIRSRRIELCTDDNFFYCREWAKDMVQHFGKIQLTGDYGEDQYFLKVLDEWMYILENEEFNKTVLSLDLKATEDLQNVSTSALLFYFEALLTLLLLTVVLTSYFLH